MTVLLLLTATYLVAQAQHNPDADGREPPLSRLSMRDICSSYMVDARIVGDQGGLDVIMDSLRGVGPMAYPLMSQWCRQQRVRMTRMVNSVKRDYVWTGDSIWMDSTHLITDAGDFVKALEQTAAQLVTRAEEYDRLEQERIAAAEAAALERARAEAERQQRERDSQLQLQKDTIKELHRSITSICDAHGVTDKVRIKELKDLFYAYLSVYNRYDLASPHADDNRLVQLEELKSFQVEMMDSVLGANSFSMRIVQFGNQLKLRAGKEHNEVTKSYQKAYRRMQVPISFKNISEYREYTGQMRDLISVQQSYLTVIELRESISENTNALMTQCGKKHRDIYSSYREVLGELNTVPAYATLSESRQFVATLNDFIHLQKEYVHAIRRIDTIEVRGDSITALCTRPLNDIAAAYKELVNNYDFIPKFINQASADRFNRTLDDFERMQSQYVTIVGLRRTIDGNSSTITSGRGTPKGLQTSYKKLITETDFTPRFAAAAAGKEFISRLEHFVAIQEKIKTLIDENAKIDANTKQFKAIFKDYGSVYKAYERLMATYDMEVKSAGESDLNQYMKRQEAVLRIQSKFNEVANSLEKEDYNRRLKKVKEVDKIKLIMGV